MKNASERAEAAEKERDAAIEACDREHPEISQLRKALAEYREKWGHTDRCYCHAKEQIDNATRCIMQHEHPHRDPRCAPEVKR